MDSKFEAGTPWLVSEFNHAKPWFQSKAASSNLPGESISEKAWDCMKTKEESRHCEPTSDNEGHTKRMSYDVLLCHYGQLKLRYISLLELNRQNISELMHLRAHPVQLETDFELWKLANENETESSDPLGTTLNEFDIKALQHPG